MLPMIRRTNDSWLPDIFNDFFDNSWMERPTYTAPAINVMENEHEYEVELAAPGLDKEDFKVHVDGEGNLHIEMEKKTEAKEGKKHGRYLRREFSYEKFQQTLLLPDDVDASRLPDDASQTIRLVRIGDYDVCPCIGKHVRSTSQIGRFEMLGTNWDEHEHSFRVRFKIIA